MFLNELPLAVIECKSPYVTNPMEAGINQLLRYANRRQPENEEGAEKLLLQPVNGLDSPRQGPCRTLPLKWSTT